MFAYKYCFVVFGLAVVLSGHNAKAKVESEWVNTADEDLTSLDNSLTAIKHGGQIQEELHQDDNKCQDDSWCWNGGTCLNNTCKCLPGTSGPFCETVEGCENKVEQTRRCGNPSNVYCIYNVTSQKPYCRCKDVDLLYDPHYKDCKACDCGYYSYSSCSFVKGKKHCVCANGYGVMIQNNIEEDCMYCFCGIYSDGCTYDGYGEKACHCKPGFVQRLSQCSECNCGPNGNCSFSLFTKQCACETGYTEKDGICQECDCGKDGVCKFDDDTGEKWCDCTPGYGIQNGICVECGCHLDNSVINCTFPDGKKKCSCPDGYEDKESVCTDINECLNETACPPNSDCRNTQGSYECTCKAGFRTPRDFVNTTEIPDSGEEQPGPDPKVVGCEDINECVESGVCTHNDTTICINNPGSYDCFCREGFILLPNAKTAEKGCRKDESSKSTVWYAVFGSIIGVIVIGLIAFFVMRKYRR